MPELSAVYDTVPVGLCVLGWDLRFVSINRQMAGMTGLCAAADIGRPLAEVMPGAAAQLEPALRRALQGQGVAELELQGIQMGAASGDRVFLLSLDPLREESGDVAGVLCTALDITERKRTEAQLRESEAHYRHAVELNPQISWTTAADGAVIRFSSRWRELTGSTEAGRLGWRKTVHPDDLQAVLRQWFHSRESGARYDCEYRLRFADGSYRWVRSRAVPLRNAEGDILCWYGTVEDVHDRKLADAALRESEGRFARAIAAVEMATWEWDLASDTLQVSPGFDALFRRPAGALRTMTAVLGAVHAEDHGQIRSAIARALRSGEATDQGVEFRIPLADGSERWLQARGRFECDAGGESPRLIGVLYDVTEKRKAKEQIAYLAYHDQLTGLANRRLFQQQLEAALAFAGRGGLLALHYLDLDEFKAVNDALGHAAGDELLQRAADRLRGCLQAGEMVARLGGDEFAIIQPGLSRAEDAVALVRRVIGTLEEPYEIGGQRVIAGASIGITLAPDDGTTPDELVRNADIALYRAKADGRGTFRFFEPAMDQAIRLAEEVKVGLRSALERDELELHFQPLLEPHSRQVTCLEVLLRWRHPTRGLITPTGFIATAEETGLIAPIGVWALRAACHEAVRWPTPIRVAVNLSPVQFRSPGLLQAVKDALTESGLAAERLELELTESVLLQYDEANLAILRQLRGLGVRIALDDFGTGFSSLGYLLRFPFDKIKIDRSFIVGLPEREESKVIVHAIIGLGRSLGISVAAEGVETAGQLSALLTEGCSEVQGYLFSRPVPAAEVAALIERLQGSALVREPQ